MGAWPQGRRANLYEVPYAQQGGWGGDAGGGRVDRGERRVLPGAVSPDDRLLAFTRVKAGQTMYANKTAEMFVVSRRPAAGEATRLRANDPPVCSGKSSPGVNNHWPKWSPDSATVGNKTYYWLIFSSNRYGLPAVTPSNGARPWRSHSSTSPPSSWTRPPRARQDPVRHLPLEPAAGSAEHGSRLGQLQHRRGVNAIVE